MTRYCRGWPCRPRSSRGWGGPGSPPGAGSAGGGSCNREDRRAGGAPPRPSLRPPPRALGGAGGRLRPNSPPPAALSVLPPRLGELTLDPPRSSAPKPWIHPQPLLAPPQRLCSRVYLRSCLFSHPQGLSPHHHPPAPARRLPRQPPRSCPHPSPEAAKGSLSVLCSKPVSAGTCEARVNGVRDPSDLTSRLLHAHPAAAHSLHAVPQACPAHSPPGHPPTASPPSVLGLHVTGASSCTHGRL